MTLPALALLTLLAHALQTGAWAMGAGAPFLPPTARAAAADPMPTVAPGGSSGLASDTTSSTANETAQSGSSGLKGIQIGARALALIDGQWVVPGATVRGARLLAVYATAAQLRHPDGRLELIALTPQVELQRRVSASPVSRPVLARAARTPSEQP